MTLKDRIVVLAPLTRRRSIPLGRILLSALLLLPIVQMARATVPVEQIPLTVQQSLAPNIMLMFDDSGSMDFNVMPDYAYLTDTSSEGLVNATVNGVYYDPNVVYLPPYKEDGVTRFASSTFTSAWLDGFNPTTGGTTDLRLYDGSLDISTTGAQYVDYTAFFETGDATVVCPTNYTNVNGYSTGGTCKRTSTSVTPTTRAPTSVTCASGLLSRYNAGRDEWRCGRGFFTYTVLNAGDYTRHYVSTTGMCSGAGLSSAVCHEDSATRQNVADWFSYYHTRMLMAKSGMMNAFADLDSSIRFGFGSINGSNNTNLPTARSTFNTRSVANVTAFGNGGSGTQKKAFWTWATGVTPSGSTPLRAALDAVGQYYQADQPWRNSSSDPTELACRQAYTILTTDGFWNESGFSLPSTPYGTNADLPNATTNTTTSQDTRPAFCATGGYALNTTGSPNLGSCVLVQTSTPTCSSGFTLRDAGSTGVMCERSVTPTCATNFTLNQTNAAVNAGLCVRSATPACSVSPWTNRINSNTSSVACQASPTTRTPTCTNSGTYSTSTGNCSRGTVTCATSPWTTLTGSGASKACEATPLTRTPTCSSGFSLDTNGASSTVGLCAAIANPTCSSGFGLTDPGTTDVMCYRSATPSCPSGYTLNSSNAAVNPGLCVRTLTQTPSCPVASSPSTPSYTLTNPGTAAVDCQRTLTTTTQVGSSVTNTGPNGQSYTYTPAPPYSDSVSNTLADVAMYYWLSDLRPSTDNKVPTSNEDPAFWQHMTTFTLGLGFAPTGISPAGTTVPQIFNWANGGTPIANFSWPVPASNTIANIADMAHAAVNGHGGFYSATSPDGFANGIQDALRRVNERNGTGASLAANSTRLETGTTTYQAVYFTGRWKGDLKAFAVNPSTGAISASPTWTASNPSIFPAAADRNIKTYNPTLAAGSRVVSFSSPADLSSAQQAALGSTTAARQLAIDYLRGDASNEQKNNGAFRNRDTALGDIVNSQPVYVGAPDPNIFFGRSFTGASDYPTFAANKLARAPRIWVAANDGMLHSFNAATGAEVFAFLPDAVIRSGVVDLTNPSYGGTSVPHQYFNDGELTIADVYYSSAWHTVLVGTTGRGAAKAIYALDITDPDSPTVLWERSSSDGLTNSNYIGQISGRPVIAQTADGTWSVLLGNGYNSTSGKAALLKFAIQSGTLAIYTAGSTTDNGLAAPAVWLADPSTGIATTAYAGDLLGKVWSFDLSGTAGSTVFTAVDSGGTAQPITAGMLAGKDPATGNLWLFFGTGRYLAQAELSNLNVQSWYGIVVQSSNSALVSNLSSGRSALVARQILAEQAATTTRLAARVVSTSTAGDMAGKSGWYTDLKLTSGTARGERMVTGNQFQGSLLIGTTRIPESSDPCSPSGSGWIMAVSPFTGAAPDSTFFDRNNDGLFNTTDGVTIDGTNYVAAGIGFSSIPNNPIFVGNTMLISFDNASNGTVNTRGTVGSLQRQSWRELVTP